MGVPVKYHHHEVGGPGQSEIETPMMGLLQAGDATMIIKYVTKMTAHSHGKTVTFMPKPLFGEAGSGMHFHQHLFKHGENVFYDASGYGCLSQAALYYIGGLLTHGPALLALTNPSTNSYSRIVPGYEAPVNLAYSGRNRSAAVRIPMYSDNPKAKRIEYRPPDPAANPYLAFAALLMAGLDGVQNKIDPGEPLDKNIYELPPEELKKVPNVAGSLGEALDCLEKDHESA
jgi:glutamine synthetase